MPADTRCKLASSLLRYTASSIDMPAPCADIAPTAAGVTFDVSHSFTLPIVASVCANLPSCWQ
jgi:hypothetical protein